MQAGLKISEKVRQVHIQQIYKKILRRTGRYPLISLNQHTDSGECEENGFQKAEMLSCSYLLHLLFLLSEYMSHMTSRTHLTFSNLETYLGLCIVPYNLKTQTVWAKVVNDNIRTAKAPRFP